MLLRPDILEQLTLTVASPGVTIVESDAGFGSTTLIDHLSERLERRSVRVQCPAMPVPVSLAAVTAIATRIEVDESSEERLLEAMVGAARASAPLMVVEDAQFLDTASLRVTRDLVAATDDDDVRFLFTASAADALADALHVTDAAVIRLGPIDREQGDRLAGRPVTDEEWASAAGNPLILSFITAPGARHSDLRSEVLDRFDRLPADGQDLVALLACAPEGLDPVTIGQLRPDPGSALETATVAGLIERRDDVWTIAHDLVRMVLDDDLTDIRRRVLHGRIARALSDTDQPERTAAHAAAASDVDLLVAFGPVAARLAVGHAAWREAAAHARAVLAFQHSLDPAVRDELQSILSTAESAPA